MDSNGKTLNEPEIWELLYEQGFLLQTTGMRLWSGRRDLNPRQPAWEAGTLPLSYSRIIVKQH